MNFVVSSSDIGFNEYCAAIIGITNYDIIVVSTGGNGKLSGLVGKCMAIGIIDC